MKKKEPTIEELGYKVIAKPRKPRDITVGLDQRSSMLDNEIRINFLWAVITPKQARKLAAWLIKAADYSESQKGEK